MPYNIKNISIKELENACHIAVQAYNMPIKYDLCVTANAFEKKRVIEDYIKKNSNANYYGVMVVKNRGRDMLPLLYQLKNRIQYYKYLCHIHTKKSNFTVFGEVWRQYLYENLLGSSELISEISHIFEENEKIGFVYPEIFYQKTRLPFLLSKNITDYLNYFLNKIFPGIKIGKEIKYPLGNIFWARIDAI